MNEHQAERWKKACEVFSSFGMPVSNLIKADKYLRGLRFDLAHGTSRQKNTTSSAMLKQWADVHAIPTALLPVKKYIDVLSSFSSSDRPLCPDKTLSHI